MNADLPEIPVIETGQDFGYDTLVAAERRAHRLLDLATAGVPRTALRTLDAVSRRWLRRHNQPQLAEIDRIAERLRRPGAYFLSVNYEWGCTCRVDRAPDGGSARLLRVLDWRTAGLGANVVAARVPAAPGEFVTLTWPGYTGMLQGLAPGRFAAALNQAPMPMPVGLYPLDWAASKARVWRIGAVTPGHLLRTVFETAPGFAAAKKALVETPIAAPCIYVLSGVAADELAVIERSETDARLFDGPGEAANHWRSTDWHGRSRGVDSAGRARRIEGVVPEFDPLFSWLGPPVLNPLTRLAMIADAREGRLLVQGFECEAPATAPLELTL